MVENEEKVMVYALVGECAVVVPAFLGCGVRKRKPIEQNRQRERGEAAAIIPPPPNRSGFQRLVLSGRTIGSSVSLVLSRDPSACELLAPHGFVCDKVRDGAGGLDLGVRDLDLEGALEIDG